MKSSLLPHLYMLKNTISKGIQNIVITTEIVISAWFQTGAKRSNFD